MSGGLHFADGDRIGLGYVWDVSLNEALRREIGIEALMLGRLIYVEQHGGTVERGYDAFEGLLERLETLFLEAADAFHRAKRAAPRQPSAGAVEAKIIAFPGRNGPAPGRGRRTAKGKSPTPPGGR